MVLGVERMFGSWGEGISLPLWGSPAHPLLLPPVWQERGNRQAPKGRSGIAKCCRQGIEVDHKVLPYRKMTVLPPSFSPGPRGFDLLVAVWL